MSTKKVFVIRNHLEQYLDKKNNWVAGSDPGKLYRSDFHDEALNTLIEVNSKDINLRGEILEISIDDKKRPQVQISKTALELEQSALSDSTQKSDNS